MFVARFLLRFSAPDRRKYSIVVLAFIWCVGLAGGIGISFFAGDSFVSLMRMAAGRPASIVNLLMVSMLPFLFSAVAVFLRSRYLLSAVCFIKAFLFGFVSSGAYMAFGSAGWLVWLMVMFSDIFCLIPLWWYWISGIRCDKSPQILHLIGCFVAAFFIISLDCRFISPLLAGLIEF